MASSRSDPKYLNWLAVGNAFRILCDGLRHYAKKEMQTLHAFMLTKLSGDVCTCSCIPGKKPNPHEHVKTSCSWAKNLGKYYQFKRKSHIPWHQSDSSKWHDPTVGYWEIAKLFMSDLGKDWSNVKDPSSTDSTGLLNLMYSCTYFKVQQSLVKSVRDCRNKWAHAPEQLLSAADKQSAFQEIFNLINDVELKPCKEVQACRDLIEDVRTAKVSILHEDELRIWLEVKYFKESESSRQVKKKRKEMERRIRELNRISTTILNLQTSQNRGNRKENSWFNYAALFTFLFGLLHSAIKSWSKDFWWIVMMMSLVRVGDKSVLSSDYGCERATAKSPVSHFGFQEFNFSSYMIYKRSNFFGRKWLFQELENLFENSSGTLGTLITGEPGSGKSALMAQLICSPFSSLLIHNNIIGYHMCDYSEKGKRNGARFVRNLVDQIAGNIPEYAEHVTNNEQVRSELDKRCESDSVGCFYSTIVGPLRELREKPDSLKYILIDALDECFEKDLKTSEILDILSNKILQFPSWLRVVLTSRNWTTITSLLPQTVKRMTLDPADERNVEDIHSYITHWLFQNSFFMDRLLEAMGLTSTTEGINSLIRELCKKGEGNFLFVKTTLHYLNESEGRVNLQSFPTSLYDTYSIYFKRQFDEERFGTFKVLFEILLAASSPLKLDVIDSILKLVDKEHDASDIVKQVAAFLRFGQDGTVRIYHQSFSEWLVNQTDFGKLSISKSKGHHYIADYLFVAMQLKNATPNVDELSELAIHLSLGGMTEMHRKRLELMNVSEIRDSHTGESVLHQLALNDRNAPIIDILLRTFGSVDILDKKRLTPAFYAALEGNYKILKLFIKKGIDVNYLFESSPFLTTWHPLMTLISEFESFSLIHVASFRGYSRIVELLMESNASFTKPSKFGLTPLHLAAEEGHSEIVQLLHNAGAAADVIALHHAAARDHVKVVELLLTSADVYDVCLPCKPRNLSEFTKTATTQDLHVAFCETALYAAVSRRHLEVVKLLLSSGKVDLECKHYSGRTPLIDAVERNDTEMVRLLLEAGADVEAQCDRKVTKLYNKNWCDFPLYFENHFFYTVYCDSDACSCGNRAIHLCARHGFWSLAESLILKWNASMLAENCDGFIAGRIAAIYDHAEFFCSFNQTLLKTTDFFLNNKAFVNSVAICGSNKTLSILINNTNSDVFAEELNDRAMTSLHFAAGWSPYPDAGLKYHYCSKVLSHKTCFSADVKNEVSKHMKTVKLLIDSQKDEFLFINKKSISGQTALHFAALAGFENAVRYLVTHGADWGATDKEGNTPLNLALEATPTDPECLLRCYRTTDQLYRICNTTIYDKTVAYLIWLKRSSIKKCNSESANLINTVIKKQMPLSLYALLKIGVDVNCSVGQTVRPLLLHLLVGGAQVSEVLKMFEMNVTVECDIPFEQSELHLMFASLVGEGIGNFFKSSVNNRSPPFQRLVASHPKGFQIFSECRDEEGYLAIHRAVEAANVWGVKWLIESGIDINLKTKSGLTVLDLSVLFLGENKQQVPVFEGVKKLISCDLPHRRNRTFENVLVETLKTVKYDWQKTWCNSKLKGFSPLHFAAVRGIGVLKFVYKRILKAIPQLPLKCINKDGIEPIYLAYLHGSWTGLRPDQMKLYFNMADTGNNLTFLYPDTEAEYHIIYNHFYNPPVEAMDQIYQQLCKQNNCQSVECPHFHDLLPKPLKLLNQKMNCLGDCVPVVLQVYEHFVKNFAEIALEQKISIQVSVYEIVNVRNLSKILYHSKKAGVSNGHLKKISLALNCSKSCRCVNVMHKLQSWSTSNPRAMPWQVDTFSAERMGWNDTSVFGDVRSRWPFSFFFKKAMNEYSSYEYLKVLNYASDLTSSYVARYSDEEDDFKPAYVLQPYP